MHCSLLLFLGKIVLSLNCVNRKITIFIFVLNNLLLRQDKQSLFPPVPLYLSCGFCVVCYIKVFHLLFFTGITIDKVALLDQETRNYVGRKLLYLTLRELFVFRFMQVCPLFLKNLIPPPVPIIVNGLLQCYLPIIFYLLYLSDTAMKQPEYLQFIWNKLVYRIGLHDCLMYLVSLYHLNFNTAT